MLRRKPAYFAQGINHTEGEVPFNPPRPVITLEKDYEFARHQFTGSASIVTDNEGPGLLPFMMVSVHPYIINDHSGLWPTKVEHLAYDFVRNFVAAQNHAVASVKKVEAGQKQALHGGMNSYTSKNGR